MGDTYKVRPGKTNPHGLTLRQYTENPNKFTELNWLSNSLPQFYWVMESPKTCIFKFI